MTKQEKFLYDYFIIQEIANCIIELAIVILQSLIVKKLNGYTHSNFIVDAIQITPLITIPIFGD